MAPEKWEKVADIFLALIIYLSLVACLIKSDYNFIIGLFGFIIWNHRLVFSIYRKLKNISRKKIKFISPLRKGKSSKCHSKWMSEDFYSSCSC